MFRIEYGRKKYAGSFQTDGLALRCALLVQFGIALRVLPDPIFAEFPVLDRGTLLAADDLHTECLRLLVGHPALVLMRATEKVQCVDALVAIAGHRIHWQKIAGIAGLPWHLPRCGTFL